MAEEKAGRSKSRGKNEVTDRTMKKKISVIVPVHNAEKYLEQCVKSITEQTYENLEILLIDDCSTDRSGEICDVFAGNDARIRVIHKTQKGGEGGAVARNEGIAAATGEIFYFIDSDDYIEPDMLAHMYERMEADESDCVVSSFHYVNDKGEELPWYTPCLSEYQAMTGKEAAKIFLMTRNIEGFSWNKLIRREVLEKYQITFDEAMNSFVDMYGMFQTVFYSRCVSFYDAQPYYYRQHEVSCVHTMSLRKLGNYKRVIAQITRLAESGGLERESRFFEQYRMVLQLFDFIRNKKNYEAAIWKQFKKEYHWKKIFGETFFSVAKNLTQYSEKDQWKLMVRLLVVWCGMGVFNGEKQ